MIVTTWIVCMHCTTYGDFGNFRIFFTAVLITVSAGNVLLQFLKFSHIVVLVRKLQFRVSFNLVVGTQFEAEWSVSLQQVC